MKELTAETEFEQYMIDHFEEEFDKTNFQHMARYLMFEAGWEAAFAVMR